MSMMALKDTKLYTCNNSLLLSNTSFYLKSQLDFFHFFQSLIEVPKYLFFNTPNLKIYSIDGNNLTLAELLVNKNSDFYRAMKDAYGYKFSISSNIINLAKKLHVTVLAEGVETREQLDFLIEQGCDLIQGYYFRPPIDTDAFTKLLQDKVTFDV